MAADRGKAFLVRVLIDLPIGPGDADATSLWIAMADSADEALQMVRRRVSPGWKVELSPAAVAIATVERLGLVKGQVWQL